MKDALHLISDDEREARMATYRGDLARWPDMHQEPDHMDGEWPPGSAVGFILAGIAAALICAVIGVVAWWVGVI